MTATSPRARSSAAHVDFAAASAPTSFGVRFNGVYRNGGTSSTARPQEAGAGVLGMDFRGDRFRASLDFGYQKQRVQFAAASDLRCRRRAVPLAPGGRNWFQPWSYVDIDDIFGVVEAEYDLAPDWTIFAAAGGRSELLDIVSGFATDHQLPSATWPTRRSIFPSWSNGEHRRKWASAARRRPGRSSTPCRSPARASIVVTGHRSFAVARQRALEPLPADFVAQPNVAIRSPPKVSIDRADQRGAGRRAVGPRRPHAAHPRRALPALQATNFSSLTGAVTSYFDQSALSRRPLASCEAVEERLGLRQLHPGPAAGADGAGRHAPIPARPSRP